MKKIILSAAVALCATSAFAVNPEDVRIYINPGHGSWTSNDRPCATVKHGAYDKTNVDTNNFFESNTNLQKGIALFYKLKEMGVPHNAANALDLTQNLVMSHVQAGPYPPYTAESNYTEQPADKNVYNRNISEIAAEVEFNNFDMFISIHSNAATEGTNTNYPLLLYRGTDAQEGNATSIAMAKAAWPHVYGLGHQQWTYYSMTNMNVRGDHDFYGSTSTVKYVITDPDYVYDETKGFSKFYKGQAQPVQKKDEEGNLVFAEVDTDGDGESDGSYPVYETDENGNLVYQTNADGSIFIAPDSVSYTGYLGVIKHGTPGFLSEGYFHTYQVARHRYMNDHVAQLEGEAYAYGINDYFGWGFKESKAVIYGILRDMDEKFTHDYYKPNASTNDKYLPLNNAIVKLLDASGAEVASYTTDDEYNGAFVFHVEPGTYSLTYSLDGYLAPDAEYTAQFTVAAGDKYYPEAFLRNENWTPPTVVYVNYPDSTAGKSGYALLPAYETKTKSYDLLAEQLTGKIVRRQIVRDNKLYVLAIDAENAPYIYLADLAAGTVAELDKAAIVANSNDFVALSDIALTADHVLVGTAYSQNTYNGTDVTQIYKWTQNAETGLPETCEEWGSTNNSANCNTGFVGKTMAYTGTLESGMVVLTGEHNTRGSLRFVAMAVNEGVVGNASYWVKMINPAQLPKSEIGEDYQIMVSPLYNEKDALHHNFVLDGNLAGAKEFTDAGEATDVVINGEISADLVNVKSNGANYFKYAGKSLMVAPKIDADGKVCGVHMFDITDGFANAKEISLEGATIEPVEYTYASAHGELALTLSSDDLTTGATIELFLVVDGKVTKFTVGDYYTSASIAAGEITGTANPFAYALKSEFDAEGKKLNVNYSLNVAATGVKIVVKDAEGNEVAAKDMGAQEAGAYTAEVDLLDAVNGSYVWEIVVLGAEKSTIERFSSLNFYHPSGLEVDNSMESGSFGTIFVCEGYNRGKTSNSTGTYVSAQADGSFGGGLYIFTPQVKTTDTSAELTQVLNKDGGARFYPSWLTNQDHNFGSSTAKTCGADFNEVQIAEDGRIFVNRYNFSGDCYLVAESLEKLVETGEFTSLLAGKTATDGIYYDEEGNYLAGPAQSFDVKGAGDDLKLIALSRSDNSIDTGGGKNYVVEYTLGSASALSTPATVAALNKKYTAAYDRKTNIQYDNKGGVWYCQYRGTPNNSEPALIYVDANGEIKYFEGTGGKSRYQGALAVAPNGERIAASSASGVVSVYDIITLEDGTVVLNEVYRLTHNMGGSAYSASFDTAGNLYLGNASEELVQGYALPRTEAAVTKAASKYAFKIGESGVSGVDEIETEENVAPVYYNLQGVQVSNPENGIYIVKRGSKVTKEYIRK